MTVRHITSSTAEIKDQDYAPSNFDEQAGGMRATRSERDLQQL